MKFGIYCADCDGNDIYLYVTNGKCFLFDDLNKAESFLKKNSEMFTKDCFIDIIEIISE